MKQIVDLILFLAGLFYLFIGWASYAGGNSTNGGLLTLGALLVLLGILMSLRKPKKNPTYMMLAGTALLAITQLMMGSLLFAVILGILVYGVYVTRMQKK